jgi:hypothetical protein
MRIPAIILNVLLMVVTIAVSSCAPKDAKEQSFAFGIWQGTYEDTPLSIEFRKDDRMVLICGCEDDIGFAAYSIDLQHKPNHLDIEFHKQSWGTLKTLVEQMAPNKIRIQHLKGGTERPAAFTADAVVLHSTESHVLQHGAKSAEERDKKLEDAMTMDTILFGGDGREQLLAICEAVFRYQFKNNASAAQQNASAYFLSIDNRDAPKDLINRFKGQVPPVMVGSGFSVGKGVKFRINSLKWIDKVTVEVEGGYYEGNVSASGNIYRLLRQDGTWKVIAKQGQWIS